MPQASLLVVDDTPENIDLLVSMLGRQDLDIMAATTGERALELVARRVPDLILLDVMMPGIDGFETCRRLRALPGLAEVPIIFVTAKTDDIGAGFAAGGADYITKPVSAAACCAICSSSTSIWSNGCVSAPRSWCRRTASCARKSTSAVSSRTA
jgi:CheY-like chemotaxis protein